MNEIQKSFAQYIRTVGYQSSTQSMMRYALKEFSEYCPHIEQADRKTIQSYHEYLESRPKRKGAGGLSSSMLRHYLYGLKTFFAWCEQTGRIQASPMSGYALPEVEKVERTILTKAEIHQLYEVSTSAKDKAILGIFYGCGLRRSEGERLNLKDIHFKKSLLYVRKGKGGKRRVIPMSKKVRTDFINYYERERGATNQAAFILNENGGRMSGNTYNERVKQLVEKSGITKRITLHSLRHSIATHLLEGGLKLEQVRDFLGHAHLETTQIYLHENRRLPP